MIRIAQPMIGEEERAAVDRVLASGGLTQGPEVAAFEAEFSALVDGRACVATNSGTSALVLALMAAGIGPGDEVIVPSFTFAATANAVALVGATVVFVDIEESTFCIDPDAVAAAVGAATAAIIPVHLYGHPASMTRIAEIAARHGLFVLEDAAQAHGATLDGRPVGAWGQAAAFSFYPTKNMTTGEGGMIVTDDPAVERRCRLLRNQGMDTPYQNELHGHNMRMTDSAAAMGRVQLARLAAFTEARRANAAVLSARLADVARLVVPAAGPGAAPVFHQYTVRAADRDRLQARLHDRDIESRVYYPTPVHQLPAFNAKADLPRTIEAARCVLSLPVGPQLSAGDVAAVAAAVAESSGG